MKTRRLFAALWPSGDVVREVIQIRDEWKQRLPHGLARFVPNPQLHLTLEFFGEIPEERIPTLWSAVVARVGTPPAFDLRLGRAGIFPPSGRPRILWLGLTGEVARVERLHTEIAEAAAPFVPERARGGAEFHPHLTLARFREIGRGDAERILEVVGRQRGHWGSDPDWVVRGIRLMRSELGPAGPNYFVEAEIPFDLTKKPGGAEAG